MLDLYLEELLRLHQESIENKTSKYRLNLLLTAHVQGCSNMGCYCKRATVEEMLKKRTLFNLIDSIFTWSFKQP